MEPRSAFHGDGRRTHGFCQGLLVAFLLFSAVAGGHDSGAHSGEGHDGGHHSGHDGGHSDGGHFTDGHHALGHFNDGHLNGHLTDGHHDSGGHDRAHHDGRDHDWMDHDPHHEFNHHDFDHHETIHHHTHGYFGFGYSYLYVPSYYRDYCNPYSVYYDPVYCARYYPSLYVPAASAAPSGYYHLTPKSGAASLTPTHDGRIRDDTIPDGVAARVPVMPSPDAPEALP